MDELLLEEVVKRYDNFTLRVDSLEIPEGRAVCVKGPNGSGKSTLLNTIAGIIFPDSGRIVHRGRDITYLEPERRRFPIIRSERGIFPHMSVKKNIEIARRVDHNELVRILSLLGISGDMMRKRAMDLSTGWKIRVSIARALAIDPEVLLIDEGLDHLDPGYVECCLKDLMNYLKEKKIITLIVTHRNNIDCDETITMLNGSIHRDRDRW